MRTGDGLLARLVPGPPLPIDGFVALCAASRQHGNGVIEVTQRGSIQFRGLTDATALQFARLSRSVAPRSDDAPQFLQSPLAGLSADEVIDAQRLVTQIREQLTGKPYLSGLGPKVSVLVDGGGTLHLDSVGADFRIRASAEGLYVSVAGTGLTATGIGWIKEAQAVATIDEVLALIAKRGVEARSRDLIGEIDALLAPRIILTSPPPLRQPAQALGRHALRTGRVALGIELAFGYANAHDLAELARTAASGGATFIQPVPARALLFIGLTPAAAANLAAIARNAGFIIDPQDPRRRLMACAGFPACESATLATRELAPAIARIATPWLNRTTLVHLSGCAKGCAFQSAAAVTITGPDRLILGGRAGDSAHTVISPEDLLAGFERLSVAVACGGGSLSDLDSSQIADCFMGVRSGG